MQRRHWWPSWEGRELGQIEASQARRSDLQGRAKKVYQRLEKVVGTFCPGLAKAPLHIHRYGATSHAH